MSGLRDTRICLYSDDRLVLVSLDCDHVSMAFLFYFDVYWISPPLSFFVRRFLFGRQSWPLAVIDVGRISPSRPSILASPRDALDPTRFPSVFL